MSLPVDVLVSEHKLILQAVGLIEKEIWQIQNSNAISPNFISPMVDFFRPMQIGSIMANKKDFSLGNCLRYN